MTDYYRQEQFNYICITKTANSRETLTNRALIVTERNFVGVHWHTSTKLV